MYSVRRYFGLIARAATFVAAIGCPALPQAQTTHQSAKVGLALPAGASSKKADEFLATLRPPTSIQALESGNDLLLDFPAIAPAGPIRFKAVSAMPRTDGIWLLSLSPQPESGSAFGSSPEYTPACLKSAGSIARNYPQPVDSLYGRFA